MNAVSSPFVGELVDDISEFFPPMSSDLVDSLVGQYDTAKKNILELSSMVSSSSAISVLGYFINGNLHDQRHGLPSKIDQLFNIDGAIGQLNADYWTQAFNLTDVYDCMPQARRNEWNEQIRNPLGVKNDKYTAYSAAQGAAEFTIPPLPEFEADNVRATLFELLNSRAKFFAERVDGIFRALSRTHVTNQPEGFGKRMILARAMTDYGTVDSTTGGYINDLRCIIAKFMGRDEPRYGESSDMMNVVRRENGVWRSVDGGALRIRIYNGVGTAHLEVHPEMAWRLNAVLASLYPTAIPSKFREKPKRARKVKDFELFDKPLPFRIVGALANLDKGFEIVKDGYRTNRKYIPNTLMPAHFNDKAAKQQFDDVLRAIGGVFSDNLWRFDYDPTEVIGEIVCSGCIPDHKSHQFYPTPESLAQSVIDLASEGAAPGMHWLEPSAGTGGISDFVPMDAHLTCYEVSDLHCKILEAKGQSRTAGTCYSVQCLDFLKLAADYRGGGYHRIVMNPPFSEGRWQSHLEGAAKMLRKGGRLVAVLPASASGKTLIDGYVHKYSNPHSNLFSGASVTVVILTLDRPE